MPRIIVGLLCSYLFLFSSSAQADVVVLKPAGATSFGAIAGSAGLASETLAGGTVYVYAGSSTSSAQLDASGLFSLTAGAGSNFNVLANLMLDGMPGINMSFSNFPALADNETRTLNLIRNSGRLVGRVVVIGGTLNSLSLSASASTVANGITERYRSTASVTRAGINDPEIWLAMPSGISTQVSARIQATNAKGCNIEQETVAQSVVLQEGLVAPAVVEWTVHLSAASCAASNVSGQFRLDGADPSVGLDTHSVSLSGPEFYHFNLNQYGPYEVSPVLQGNYTLAQTSIFLPPYGELVYANTSQRVAGPTTMDLIQPIGTAHGNITLTGDWDLSQPHSIVTESIGIGSTPLDTMSAYDEIDHATGKFDFALAVGTWNFTHYAFDFLETLPTRNNMLSLNIEQNPADGVNRYPVTQGQWLDLPPVIFETAKTLLEFQVEQQPGQPAVTVESIEVTGGALLHDPATGAVTGSATVNAVSLGDSAAVVPLTLYGVPGIYSLTATGIGSNGLNYQTRFLTTLGAGQGPGPGDPVDPMACFAVNYMKVYGHKGKIYIKDAVFSVAENTVPDLAQNDVTITIDGLEYRIPAGSFKKRGKKPDFIYKSEKGSSPKIKVRLDFHKSKWKVKIKDEDIEQINQIDNSDGVDVSLVIGNYQGTENITMRNKSKHGDKLRFKRKPKVSCRTKHHDDDDDDDDEREEEDDREDDDDRDHEKSYYPRH